MTALQHLDAMPDHFKSLLRQACPDVFTMQYHTLDHPMRYADLFEMYSGSARISTMCEKDWLLMFPGAK